MKLFKFFFAFAVALMALYSCDDSDETYEITASVSSTDPNFTATADGGSIRFKTEGGQVVLNVTCNTDWAVENTSPEYFGTSVNQQAGTLTVTASQNTIEEDLEGVLTLKIVSEDAAFATITITQSAYGAPEISVETNELKVPAVGELTTEIGVESSIGEFDFEVGDGGAWLTVEKTNTGISLTASENVETEERTTTVTVTANDGIRSNFEIITVLQDARAYITLSEESLVFDYEENSASVTVDSNYDWDYDYDKTEGWYTISKNGNTLTITVVENETKEEREGIVVLTASDGFENTADSQLTITQGFYIPTGLILEYTTTTSDANVILPINSTDDVAIDCTVDWGDGATESCKTPYPSHTYTDAGVYDVTIDGTVPAIKSNDTASGMDNNIRNCLTAVKQWGITGLTTMEYSFWNCGNLASLAEVTESETFAEVTTFQYAFYECSALTSLPNGLFKGCSKCTSFYATFSECTGLTSIPADLFSGCAAATNFTDLFVDCENITACPEGLLDDCVSAKVFENLFENCSALASIPAKLFYNCPNATEMDYVFDGCAITEIPEGLFDNNPAVENMEYVFSSCPITSVPKEIFYYNTNVTSFSGAFNSCKQLTSVDENLFCKNESVESFTSLFSNCTALTSVPGNLFSNNPAVTSFNRAFYGCTGLTSLPANLFDKNTKAKTFQSCFQNCSNLTGESPYTEIAPRAEPIKVHLYERANYEDYFTAPTTTSNCFNGCTGLSDYSSIPSGWK